MRILLKAKHPEVQLPTRAYPTSVGLDLHAHLLDEDGKANSTLVPAGSVRGIPTGLIFGGIDDPVTFGPDMRAEWSHWTLFPAVCSRSGLATSGVFVANAPGIIDPEYRGEILVLLFNGGVHPAYVRHRDKIAQLVLLPVPRPIDLQRVTEVTSTDRGAKGFGSSGR